MLEKIRRACSLSDSPALPASTPDFPCFQDPVIYFQQKLEEVGGEFFHVSGEREIVDSLNTVLKETRATEIFWESEEVLQKHGVPYILRDPEAFSSGELVYSSHFQFEAKLPLILSSKRYDRQTLAAVRLSTSSAYQGIAETATIVHAVTPGIGRLLSALPPAHITWLSKKDLLMNHAEFFASLVLGRTGSVFTLVTGPSRTADIEKKLVVGVHGPKKWIVILTP